MNTITEDKKNLKSIFYNTIYKKENIINYNFNTLNITNTIKKADDNFTCLQVKYYKSVKKNKLLNTNFIVSLK